MPIDGFEDVYRLEVGGATAFVAIHFSQGDRAFGGIRVADSGPGGTTFELRFRPA